MKENQLTIKEIPAKAIPENSIVTHYSSGNYSEVVCSRNHSFLSSKAAVPVIRMSKDEYVDTNTGELKKYKKNVQNHRTKESLAKQYKNLPKYIKGNFEGNETEKMITLTYSKHMNDLKRLSKDINVFMRKLNKRYPSSVYVYVKEPSESGSWHIHIIFKRLDGKVLDITEAEVLSLWKKALSVKVQPISNIQTLPYYFNVANNKEKLERIKYYPPYGKIFGYSQKLKLKKERGLQSELENKLEDKNLIYEKEVEIKRTEKNGEEKVVNTINYRQYYSKK